MFCALEHAVGQHKGILYLPSIRSIFPAQTRLSGNWNCIFSHYCTWQLSPHLLRDKQKMSEHAAFDVPTKLWSHSSPKDTQIYAFKEHVAQKYQLTLPTYHELWQWSIDHPASFWEEIWHQTGIIEAKPYNSVRLHISRYSVCD
jgi:hypothetical protein